MIVLDTHALVWWVTGDRRISARARGAIRKALRKGPAHVSTISVLEIATAVRRGRLEIGYPFEQWLADVRSLSELQFEPVGFEVASQAGTLGESAPGDPADRIIAATALVLGAKLVTADKRLAATEGVETVW